MLIIDGAGVREAMGAIRAMLRKGSSSVFSLHGDARVICDVPFCVSQEVIEHPTVDLMSFCFSVRLWGDMRNASHD